MLTRTKEKVSRSFKRDFPEFVALVEKLDLSVRSTGGKRVNDMPTYWLDGDYQLTGYKTAKDGGPFTKEMATEHIRKVLMRIAEGRDELASVSREERFGRIIDGMRTIELKRKNFCAYRHPNGDRGTILYDGNPVTAWVQLWDEDKDAAHAEDVPLEQLYTALNASFANGGITISGRKQTAKAS